MTNVDQSFDASGVMREISKISPFILLLSAVGTFFFQGFFSVAYYEDLFSPIGSHARTMAVTMAVITELVRFSLLLASIRDFSDQKKFNGWLGLVASIGLVFHEISVSRSIAKSFYPENSNALAGALIFFIIVGFVLEIRLIMTMRNPNKFGSKSKKIVIESTKKVTAQNGQKSNGVYTAKEN